jgi:hypothetical protein
MHDMMNMMGGMGWAMGLLWLLFVLVLVLADKTDASDEGPQRGARAFVGAGMMGDRADVIFASPVEISGSISQRC